MDLQELINFYILTQGEIDKLWEFYIVGHLAIIGWLVTVNTKHIERVRKVLATAYIVLFGAIYFFFFEAYADMALIQKDMQFIVSNSQSTLMKDGYIDQLLSANITARLVRVSAVYAVSLACTVYLLFSKKLFQTEK